MIALSLAQLKAIADAGEAAYPAEACGLLVGAKRPGDHWRVGRVAPARNVATDPRRRFEVDPGLRIGLERELRGTDRRVIGHYHSHPDGPARPSATDLAMVHEPDLVWLIAAVVDGQASQTLAYVARLDGTGFREIAIRSGAAPAAPGDQQQP